MSAVYYLPLSLTNPRKRRFSAGRLWVTFRLRSCRWTATLKLPLWGGLIRELNDCYCLSLPPYPALCRGNGSPLDEPEIKKLIMVGRSYTRRLSALVSASIETICFKLPNQSQTNAEKKALLLASELAKLG